MDGRMDALQLRSSTFPLQGTVVYGTGTVRTVPYLVHFVLQKSGKHTTRNTTCMSDQIRSDRFFFVIGLLPSTTVLLYVGSRASDSFKFLDIS
jgi:hypothetical protein